MIVPIVFSLAPWDRNLVYGWNFIKSVDFASKYRWPVIAPARYFDWEKLIATSPVLLSELCMEVNDYEKPAKAMLERIIPLPIPVSIEKAFIRAYPSQTDAYLASGTHDWPAMEDCLCEAIRQAEKQTGEKTEAIMALTDYQFLRNVAKKLGIFSIFYEWSSIRKPLYDQRLYFMDFQGLQQNIQLSERYHAFQDQKRELPILARKELLALFLRKEDLCYLDNEKLLTEPSFELGVALPGNFIHYAQAHNMINIDELCARAQEVFASNEICFRFHPGHDHITIPGAVHIDNGSHFDFILRCKRILSAGSNISFDVALFNRPAYDESWTMYELIANRHLEALADTIPTDEMLSFIAFCFFVPTELLWSAEYLRYRFSKPSEAELYMYHLSYCFNALSLDKSILELPASDRLTAILANRISAEYAQSWGRADAPIWAHSDEQTRKEIRLFRSQKVIEHLRGELTQLQEEKDRQLTRLQEEKDRQLTQLQIEKDAQLMDIRNSRSYKLALVIKKATTPFRRRIT